MNQQPADLHFLPKKYVLGLQFYERQNSICNNWGVITDQIMAMRGSKGVDSDYFTHVATIPDNAGAIINNPEKERELRVTTNDITFSVGLYYEKNSALSFADSFDTAKLFFSKLIKFIPFASIRRVGIVGEYRAVVNGNPSEYLFSKISIPAPVNPYGFICTYQSRRFDKNQSTPKNLDLVSFKNILFSYYDSSVDQKPADSAINANLDVQEYFYPPLPIDETASLIAKHQRFFLEESRKFKSNANNYGLHIA